MKKKLSVISILIMNRNQAAEEVNKVLSQNAKLFLGRFGLPLSKRCLKNCSALINVVSYGTEAEEKKLIKDLKDLKTVNFKISSF